MAGNLTEVNALHAITKAIGLKGHYSSETATGAVTLDSTYGTFIKIDPGGAARDVTLPAEAGSEGRTLLICNTADAAEDLTVKDDGASTIGTVSQNECAIFTCDGTSWYLVFILTGAPS